MAMDQERAAAPFFSIVVPAYNRGYIIDRTINSCLAQTFADFEIVIVDDGSADDTAEVVARFDDPRIIYHQQKNAGASAARNRGAEIARGAFVAFLDSDDEFLPGKLQAFHAAIRARRDEGPDTVWYSPLWFHRGEGNRICKPDRAIRTGEPVGDYLFATDGMMQTSTLVVPKVLTGKVPFDTRLRNLEDLDLCLRLEAEGARFAMIPDPQVIWYDDVNEGRLSYTTTAENVRNWLALQKGRLSAKAYHGFLARYLVPVTIRSEPFAALGLLAKAIRAGSISLPRAASLALRGAMPQSYGRLRDALVSLRLPRANPLN